MNINSKHVLINLIEDINRAPKEYKILNTFI